MSEFENLENYFYDPEDKALELLTDKQKESIRRQSMENTYTLIINDYNFDIFPEKLFWLLTDFDEPTVFDVLIDYYIDTEEYEKCAQLKIIQESIIGTKGAEKRGKFTYKLGFDEDDSPLKS